MRNRDAKIEKLARDLATLQELVKRLLSSRRSSTELIPEGQGMLFPDAVMSLGGASSAAEEAAAGRDDEKDGALRSKQRKARAGNGKIDTTGLPREDRVLPARVSDSSRCAA